MTSKEDTLKKKKLLNNLYSFYDKIVARDYNPHVKAYHIFKLSKKLEEIHRGKIERLNVSMPPRFSKSSIVTLAFPLWIIFQDPDKHILIINAEASLSENFGIRLREYVKRYGKYFNVYLSDVKHSSTHLKFEDKDGNLYQGSIRLVGADGSITGQDASYVVIDDPYKGFKDITPTLLQKKIEWFKTIVLQRLEPESKLLILHTRWHTNDLQGYLKKKFPDRYEFLELPAIQDDGTSLWPEKYNVELLLQKKEEMGDRLFEAIFQQKPIDESSDFFDLSKIHWERPKLKVEQKVRGYDTASSDPSVNDYTAGVPMYLLEDDNVLITDFLYGQFGSKTNTIIKKTVREDGVDNISAIETGVAAAGKLLFEEWEEQLSGYFIERAMAVPNNSKADRATPLRNAILDGKVYVDITDDELRQIFIDEFKAFPNGAHDDIVDAAAHAYNCIKENFIGALSLEIIDL